MEVKYFWMTLFPCIFIMHSITSASVPLRSQPIVYKICICMCSGGMVS